jgi:indole-3-acetate monooxygenase
VEPSGAGAAALQVVAGAAISVRQRAQVRLAACQAMQFAIQAVDVVLCAGGSALYEGNRLERCFRDVHAAGQHVALTPMANLETIGRVLFGLDPGMARL